MESFVIDNDRTYLMHLNSEYNHPERGGDLFVLDDLTQAVNERFSNSSNNNVFPI